MTDADHRLIFGDFEDQSNPLNQLESSQADYLRCYLKGLKANRFILESGYFDRDYLAEFSAYYATSAKRFVNYCHRIHFFDQNFSDDLFYAALADKPVAKWEVNASYLGFIVIRPIPKTEIGRTVLKWYDNRRISERISKPSRPYRVHLAGLPLEVIGLAWQQQDAAVAACATVGLWTILHSSAFDDSHFIPTTVEITRAAEGFGSRAFPSQGLTIEQIQEAIKKLRLAPILSSGSVIKANKKFFTPQKFASICSSFIRSGFPVLLGCLLYSRDKDNNLVFEGKHAVCAVGLREANPRKAIGPSVVAQDDEVTIFYLHDDNIGPSVRFKLIEHEGVAALERAQPDYLNADERHNVSRLLIPDALVIAVHENFRVSPYEIAKHAYDLATIIMTIIADSTPLNPVISYSTSFFRLSEYIGPGIGNALATKTGTAAQARIQLSALGPMSLIVGVIRLSRDNIPLVDILLDTSDGDHRLTTFAHVVYDDLLNKCFDAVDLKLGDNIREILEIGPEIKGY